MNQSEINDIVIAKLADRELSKAEENLFAEWCSDPTNEAHYRTLLRQRAAAFAGEAGNADAAPAWEKIRPRNRKPTGRRLIRYAAAAAVIGAAVIGTYIFTAEEQPVAEIIHPGEFKAILTIAGQETFLSDTDTVVTGIDGRAIFSNSAEGLVYLADNTRSTAAVINILTIPRGGHYKVGLSDGTTVWLNSETSLRFPAVFDGSSRMVEVEGEAYFKVAADKSRPFIVRTRDYDVRVTGTEFNVRNYNGIPGSTTLVEGAVQVERDGAVTRLRPGQQAVLSGGLITVRDVNTDDCTAWQQGGFAFTLERLEDITAELSRWYNIDIAWDDEALKDMRFTAWFSRDSDIDEIMNILQKTRKISFRLKDKTLIIGR